MATQIEQFREAWRDVRGLTYEFMECVPESAWQFSPAPSFASLVKQLRHLVCVQGCYHQGLREGVADFSRKHSHYEGPLEPARLLVALRRMDDELERTLHIIAGNGEQTFAIDFFGQRRGFSRYAAILIQHEALHHGQWSIYAALAGFPTPIGWKVNWGL